MSLAPTEIGQRIKTARKRAGETQLSFALKADVSPGTVSNWERGKLPPVRELIRIAELLGVSTDYLVEEEAIDDDRLTAVEARLEELDGKLDRVLRILGDVADADADAAA